MSVPSRVDVIVVGSGAGGAAAAYELARAGASVLVLEKGGVLPRDGSTLDIDRVVRRGEFLSQERWVDGDGRELVPEEHFNVGGKTCWYGAALLRFAPHEFAADEAHGCSGWPITYADLAPFYAEAEALLGVRRIAIEPALAAILERLQRADPGWTSTALPMGLAPGIENDRVEARHFDGFASVAGLKADAKTAFLDRVAALPNLHLEIGAEVEEPLMDQLMASCVRGVRLTDGRVFEAPVVLLAAGALHSPRLLARMIAQREPSPDGPSVDLIGRHLKLHLLTALVAVSPGLKRDEIRKTVLLGHPEYPHSSVQPLGFDGELIATLIPRLVPRPIAAAVGARSYGFFLQTEDGSAHGNRVMEVAGPRGVSRVLDYSEQRVAVAATEHRRFVQAFQRALLGSGMLSFGQRIGIKGTAHACGTLPTGHEPARSVVDSTGRVHGMHGLYVVDGSVLPRSSRVNPSLTIFAWGLRVARGIAGSLAKARMPRASS